MLMKIVFGKVSVINLSVKCPSDVCYIFGAIYIQIHMYNISLIKLL